MTVLTRKALYDRVWAEPVRTVAAGLGISDVGLRKICDKAQIPLPPRGHWARLRAGQSTKPTPLPPRGPGMPLDVRIGARPGSWGRMDPEVDLAEPPPVPPEFEEPIEAMQARVTAQVGKVRYERDLSSPHPVIRALLADDEIRRLKPQGAPWRLASSAPLFTSAFERRRLRLLSSLFLALHKFGGEPWVADAAARKITVMVGEARLSCHLDHPDAKPDRNGEWRTRDGWADVLRLTLNGQASPSWSDTEEHGLEAFLADIVVAMIMAAERSYRAAAHGTHERALRQRQELADQQVRRQLEAERQARAEAAEAEKARRARLVAQAGDLRAADDIRTLVARALARRGPDDATAATWGEWALDVAEQLDPIAGLMDDWADLGRSD